MVYNLRVRISFWLSLIITVKGHHCTISMFVRWFCSCSSKCTDSGWHTQRVHPTDSGWIMAAFRWNHRWHFLILRTFRYVPRGASKGAGAIGASGGKGTALRWWGDFLWKSRMAHGKGSFLHIAAGKPMDFWWFHQAWMGAPVHGVNITNKIQQYERGYTTGWVDWPLTSFTKQGTVSNMVTATGKEML